MWWKQKRVFISNKVGSGYIWGVFLKEVRELTKTGRLVP